MASRYLPPPWASVCKLACNHAGIPDEEAPGELPAAQVFLDLGDRGDVDRVARKDPVAHRESVPGDRQTDHDLGRVAAAVLAVTAFPRGSVGLLAGRGAAVNLALFVAFELCTTLACDLPLAASQTFSASCR